MDAVLEIQPLMNFEIWLNDLPDNNFDLTLATVSEELSSYKNVTLRTAGRSFLE